MGSWGAGAFENDTALDWAQSLVDAGNAALIRPLRKVVNSRGTPDAPECEEAVAAAAVLAAACRNPPGKLPDEVKDWVISNGFNPRKSQLHLAGQALKRLTADSELAELWAESDQYSRWLKAIAALSKALANALESPIPARKPKTPRAPPDLPRLLDRMSADETGPRRKKVRLLLAALMDVNAPLPRTVREPPLCLVAARGLVQEATELIDRGADVNADSGTRYGPLTYAASRGHAAMVDLLIQRGAALQKAPHQASDPSYRYTPGFFSAATIGSVATLKVFTSHGVDIQQRDLNEETLLHKAAAGSAGLDAIRWLVEAGLSPNAKENMNQTPLHYAVRSGRFDVVECLLALGADPNIVGEIDGTPLDILQSPDSKMGQLLRKHGGKLASELHG